MTAAAERIGAFVDIGTNSVRLMLVRVGAQQGAVILNEQKEVVRLGEGEFVDGYLQPEAMDRAVLVCRTFAEMARANGADEILAIATSATREARNQEAFVERLQREAGLDVRVISGREEARLIYLGVASGVHLGDRQALFIDIGGGSTELAVGDQHQVLDLDSLKLGAIRLSALFFLPDEAEPVSPERYALIRRYVQNAAVRPLQRLRAYDMGLAVGSSGTIENLADIAARRFLGRPRERDDTLTRAQLDEVVTLLCGLPLDQRRQVPGINPGRADIIVAGAAILQMLMEELDVAELLVTDRGLRDGLLVDFLARHEHGRSLSELSVRERSVLQLGRTCGFDEPHARHAAALAQALFDSARAAGLHDLGDWERELLGYAALLHDVGSFLSYGSHHHHSHYVIRHADLLGFDQTELALMAAVARFHRKGLPRKRHPEYAALDKRSRGIVRPLCVFLRLAETLDRSHAGLVRGARLEARGMRAVLTVETDADPQLELWGLEGHRRTFERFFGRELEIELAVPERPPAAAAPAGGGA